MDEDKKQKESIAKKYWRDFESFVLEYLKDYYHVTEDKLAKLTPPSGDGGYDGVIYGIDNFSEKSIQEILFEAKLRSALGNALPMNDFCKALIIAINRFSETLYIATNIAFSSETKDELEHYKDRTGIIIKTLNGKDLFGWYQKYTLSKSLEFKTEFIDFLKESAARISDNDSVPSCFVPAKQFPTTYISDFKREEDLEKLIQLIWANKKGLLLIKGNQGSGKSSLCKNILEKVRDNGYLSAEIDIKYADTSRAFFLALLQIIWGLSPELITNCSETELNLIFSKIGGQQLDNESIKCFKQIFGTNVEAYTGHWDIYQYSLISFIDKLFGHYTKKKKYCIHIHNLETGYYESTLFILKIISKLQKYHIIFLIELRDDYNGAFHIKSNEWADIYSKFTNLDMKIKEYLVYELSEREKRQYIAQKIPGLSNEQLLLLIKYLPNNPLVLEMSLATLAPRIASKYLLESEFKNELDFFARSYDNEIIRQSIQMKIRHGGFETLAAPCAMLSLLGGKGRLVDILEIIEYDEKKLVDDFWGMGIFYIQNDVVEVKNELYCNSLQNHSDYITVSALQQLAHRMLKKVDIFYRDNLEKEKLRLRLVEVLKENEAILKLSCEIGRVLFKQGDIQQAFFVYEKGYNIFSSLSFKNTKHLLLKLEILKNMLCILDIMEANNTDKARRLLQEFRCLVSVNRRKLKHNDIYRNAYLNLLVFEMKRFHRLSLHSECLKCAYIARRFARKAEIYEKYPETMEKILWLKALSIKHLSGINACIQSFKSDIKKNPDLPLLIYSYNTHKTATISRKEPKLALKYFRANERYYPSLSMAHQLHNRVNIANMHFFLRDYDVAVDMANHIVSDALTYDVTMELGRIYNLIGNYNYIFEQNDVAIQFYERAIHIFEKMEHYIHLWPPLVNLASVYLANKDYKKAYAQLKEAATILIRRKLDLESNRAKDANHGLKLYIGVIVVLWSLHSFPQKDESALILYNILLEETQKYLPSDIEDIISSITQYNKFFNDSAYEHKGKIVLKV